MTSKTKPPQTAYVPIGIIEQSKDGKHKTSVRMVPAKLEEQRPIPDPSGVPCQSALSWGTELAALPHGESIWKPAFVTRIDWLPLLMPAGFYTKRATDDLITFTPDPGAAGPR